MKQTNNFRPLWDATLGIYDAVKEICEQNKLRYFVAYGTLIGAVRHNGFIPWDDDFDVYMPRPDYEKFMILAKEQLPNYYSWHSVENDADYSLSFGKVCECRSNLIKHVSQQIGYILHEGIYIDVFPLDGMPSSSVGYFLWCVQRAILRRFLDGKHICGRLFSMIFRLGEQEKRILFQRWMSRISYETSKRVASPSGYGATLTPHRWWLKRDWFLFYKEIRFEDRIVRIPNGTHELLSNIYGDYMSLPPEAERIPRHLKI